MSKKLLDKYQILHGFKFDFIFFCITFFATTFLLVFLTANVLWLIGNKLSDTERNIFFFVKYHYIKYF